MKSGSHISPGYALEPRRPAARTLATDLQPVPHVTDLARARSTVSGEIEDAPRLGSTLLGVIPRGALDGAVARARGSRPLTGVPVETGKATPPVSTRVVKPAVRDDHEESWTHFDTLKPQADRVATRRFARIARWLTLAAVAVVGLLVIGYLATTTFFFFSKSWIAPMVVQANDDRVVALNGDLATHQRERDRLAAELAAAERPIASLAATIATTRASNAKAAPKARRDLAPLERDLARVTAARDALAQGLAQRDQLIAEVKSSPYLRAAAGGNAVMAVAPYGNLDDVGIGTAVYACKLQMVWCHQVGTVADVLRGEVTFKHPHRNRQLVGRMLELRLADHSAADAEVLFVGGAPLWL
jgi:hypothetical protein